MEPLSDKAAIDLVKGLAGEPFTKRYGGEIAKHSRGLPLQIVSETTTLLAALRRGRTPSPGSELTRETGDSFERAYARLDPPSRLLLHAASIFNPQRIPKTELSRALAGGVRWSEAEFVRALDGCLDLHVLEGVPDPGMHQLLSRFLQSRALSSEDQIAVGRIREAQRSRFVGLARAVVANPADSATAGTFISYPSTPEVWEELGVSIDEGDESVVGRTLYEIGRFREARPWFERAVAAKERGDVHGRIDHESLGTSLGFVGDCLWRTGQHKEALPWFERAVAAKEKGDVHGRIDHDSLGRSLHLVGYCLSSTGHYAEARPWFERAVAAAEKGDVHGRINHDSLGRSLHLVGYCLSSTGQYEEARPWFKRAVAAKEKGDIHGRINRDSLRTTLQSGARLLRKLGDIETALQWEKRAADLHQTPINTPT